jgi:glycolate oxidase
MNQPPTDPAEFLTLHEIVLAAKARLPGNIWHYVAGATETETAFRRNRLAIEGLALRPRVLRDTSEVSVRHRFLGRDLRLPVAIAPIGGLESLHATGGAGMARAAGAFGVPMFLSSVAEPGLEATAEAAPDACRIFQLYVRGNADWIDVIVARVVAAGYTAFCITVDTQHYSRRERDIARRFSKPWRARVPGQEFQSAFNWNDVRRFKAKHRIPLLLKGIMTAEDAAMACDLGVEGIYVSNHGGRQLDHVEGALDALRAIAPAVAGRAQLIVDGGFYRGTDVVKALCLGADLVGMGRLPCFGLGAAGEAGVVRGFEILEDEIRIALGLLGVTRIADLGPAYVRAAPPAGDGTLESAFPLLRPGSH